VTTKPPPGSRHFQFRLRTATEPHLADLVRAEPRMTTLIDRGAWPTLTHSVHRPTSLFALVCLSFCGFLSGCGPSTLSSPPTPDLPATVEAQVRATVQSVPTVLPTAIPLEPTIAPPAPPATAIPVVPTATAAALTSSDIADRARVWLVHIARGGFIGSGIVVSTDGLVLTNAHVISDTGPIRITLSDQRTVYADVVFEDTAVDLALLRTAGGVPAAAPFGDTSKLRGGDPIVVMGFALDLPGEPTITRGVFSSRRSDIKPNRVEYLQTDAAMNPGVSGGPMLNMNGEVVGINTWGVSNTSDGRPVQGVNFAIPAELAMSFVAAGRDARIAVAGAQATAPAPAPTALRLTAALRTELLAAVDRANNAWTEAKRTLDTRVLRNRVAGRELSEATDYINGLRAHNVSRIAVMDKFNVKSVDLAGDTLAYVHTSETWHDDVLEATTGKVVQREAPATYSETYTVERVGGNWIVTYIQL
jgi:S1-C subfamily serine protease